MSIRKRELAYVRAQKRGNRTYYYLVEGKREGKKVKQTVLRYLGTKNLPQDSIDRIITEIRESK